MKKYISIILISGMVMLLSTSCIKKFLNDYLDKAPESGLTEGEVFSTLANFKDYFDAVYSGQKYYSGSWRDSYNIKNCFAVYFDFWDQKYTWEGITDCSDGGRYMEGHAWKSGNMSETIVNKITYDGARRPILESMFMDIRIANKALTKVDSIMDASTDDINDLKGQAFFVRALCRFTLFKIWGPMPYITKVIGPEDEWDLPRLTAHQTCMRIAQDLDSAYKYFVLCNKVRRDPMPGSSGSLDYSTYQMYRPNGMAAKGLKSRVLLYAASPENNAHGIADWDTAAQASWEAIQIAISKGVTFSTQANRVKNYVGAKVSEESLWTWDAGSLAWNSGNFAGWFPGVWGNSASSWSGSCPTQNWVDKYETKWGEPLNTAADRAAAIAAGHFKEQDPYSNRDWRLATDVVTNGSTATGWSGGIAQMWYNSASDYGEQVNPGFLGRSFTGYYMRKFWGDNTMSASQKNQKTLQYSDPVIRITELYLNYAEAANEAYGPTTAPGYSFNSVPAPTAVAALNYVRQRTGTVINQPVLAAYTGSTADLRPRIKNERNVELSFEGHYYFDIRRWNDLREAQGSTLFAVTIKKVPVDATYTKGYMYTRSELSADRQPTWKPQMYYMPFNNADYLKMHNFVGNPVW